MEESKRRISNVAMDQIIGNMTSSMHNSDGHYVQLGFTPPPSPAEQQHNWTTQSKITKSPFIPYNVPSMHSSDSHNIYSLNQQMPPQYAPQQNVPFNYVQQSNLYATEPEVHSNPNYIIYRNHSNQSDLYQQSGYKYFIPPDIHLNHNTQPSNNFIRNETVVLTNSPQSVPNPTQLIENVVGNWVPNTNGTYSPFGNPNTGKQNISNIFEMPTEIDHKPILDDNRPNLQETDNKKDELPSFHFNRDTKKPRIVAEVKPMRPSYSDVLIKSAPTIVTKLNKTDVKEVKQKKESKKIGKNEKGQKLGTPRLKVDKNLINTKTNEKKDEKQFKLNRKWASLDNVNGSGSDLNDDENNLRKKKSEDLQSNKSTLKGVQQKVGKKSLDLEDDETENNKNDILNISRTNVSRKFGKITKQRNSDGEKVPPAKRNLRVRKRENQVPLGIVGQKIKQYIPRWWKLFVNVCMWLFNLVSDICSLSVHLSRDMFYNFFNWLKIQWITFTSMTIAVLNRIKFLNWIWDKIRKKKEPVENSRTFLHPGLQNNINMPTTGEEAMKRLLACKGKDPYGILGLTPTCTDDDIKRYYKRQAFLVHPDKNQQPGAEEAFKILVHAFDMIGEPERRAAYDRGVAESAQVEQAWSELTELLAQLQKKVEAAANTIRCSACGLRHKRIKIDKPSYAARNCATCKIHHGAREGDIWAEARCMGFLWHYYACMEGGVYDITEWAACQKDSLKHLKPDSHHVQYRIALGKQNAQTRRQNASLKSERPPDLENLLNSLYGNQDNSQNLKRKNKKTK